MSLFSCPECNHTVSSKALSCPGCGFPVSVRPIPQHMAGALLPAFANQTSERPLKKLPNGYGSIKKLSGNRSKPYAAYPSSCESTVTGGQGTKRSAIGYYSDWYSAFDALCQYRHTPYTIRSRSLTFADVYHLFYKEKFEYCKKGLSVSSKYAYETAFKNCESLHPLLFCNVRKQEMQNVLDECTLGYSSLCNLKKLFSQLYRYAIENDITEKNYAQFVTIHSEDDNEKGEPFSQEELALLWKHKEDNTVQMILIMIYSGFRIKAFETIEIHTEQLYFKGGVKTAAGKGRIVPIHPSIRPFALEFYHNFPSFRSRTFRSSRFYPTLERLGIATTKSGKKHTPHDCRHTFSWLCDKYEVNEFAKHLLMGHSLGKDIEKSVYGHRTFEELCTEINKIKVEV